MRHSAVEAHESLKTTSISLLERLKNSAVDSHDWRRLHDIYAPLIASWLARVPGGVHDAADLQQEVMIVLVREIPVFERRRQGSFRAWLRQVTVNRVRTRQKQQRRRRVTSADEADVFLSRLADPADDLAQQWDVEHDRHVCDRLLQSVRGDFNARTWHAFQRFALDGLSAADTAAELGLSENAVLQAKSRVLKRLREEAGELLG